MLLWWTCTCCLPTHTACLNLLGTSNAHFIQMKPWKITLKVGSSFKVILVFWQIFENNKILWKSNFLARHKGEGKINLKYSRGIVSKGYTADKNLSLSLAGPSILNLDTLTSIDPSHNTITCRFALCCCVGVFRWILGLKELQFQLRFTSVSFSTFHLTFHKIL